MPCSIYVRTIPAWNKGLTKETDVRVKNYGEKRIGIKCSVEHIKNMKISHNTPEYRENARLKKLGKKQTEEHKRNHKIAMNRPAAKEKARKTSIISWSNPEVRKKHLNGLNNSKVKEKRLKTINDPIFKDKFKETMKKVMNTLEVKEKRALTLAKHLADGTIKPKMFNTKPELVVFNDYINRGYVEGIDIIKQYHCKGVGLVDFYLPKENILIFVDGDYWHCNPNSIYGRPCFYQQQSGKFAFDIWIKDKIITNKAIVLGYKVIRLWESDIKKDLKVA